MGNKDRFGQIVLTVLLSFSSGEVFAGGLEKVLAKPGVTGIALEWGQDFHEPGRMTGRFLTTTPNGFGSGTSGTFDSKFRDNLEKFLDIVKIKDKLGLSLEVTKAMEDWLINHPPRPVSPTADVSRIGAFDRGGILIERNGQGQGYIVKLVDENQKVTAYTDDSIEIAFRKAFRRDLARRVAQRISKSKDPTEQALKEAVEMFGPDAISKALHKSGLKGPSASNEEKRTFSNHIAKEFSRHLKEVGSGESESTVFRHWDPEQNESPSQAGVAK